MAAWTCLQTFWEVQRCWWEAELCCPQTVFQFVNIFLFISFYRDKATTEDSCRNTTFSTKRYKNMFVSSGNLAASEAYACLLCECEPCHNVDTMFYGVCTCDKSTEELKCFSTMLKAMCQHLTTKSIKFPWTVSLPLIVYHSSVSGGWPLWLTGLSPWGDHVSVESTGKSTDVQTSVPVVAPFPLLCFHVSMTEINGLALTAIHDFCICICIIPLY